MLNRFQGEASGMLHRLFLMLVILRAAKDLLFLHGQNPFLVRAPSPACLTFAVGVIPRHFSAEESGEQ